MLVVGDTNDVFLYNVKSGGRDFEKIAKYKGSNDAGFSTSWSKDGRKFVVASQGMYTSKAKLDWIAHHVW